MKVVIKPEYESERIFIEHLPQNFEKRGTTIYDQRNKIKRFDTALGEWIVKRYKIPNLMQRMVYTFFRKTKAERAYEFAEQFRVLGISTPPSIAYVEVKERWLFKTGYLVCGVCNDPDLREGLRNRANFDKKLADEFAAFLVRMHEQGVLHGDLNLSNVLYRREGEGYRFSVIDINRSRFKSALTKRECLHNLTRLTHRRDLLEYIVRRYASIRCWDVEKVLSEEFRLLEKLEMKGKMKEKVRRWK